MSLTSKQQVFITVAAIEAKGDISGLKVVLNDGLNKELTINEAKETLSHLYAYTGFPRSLNALNALQQVIKEREEKGLKTEKGVEADALPTDYDALKTGTAIQTQLTGGKPFCYTFAPQMDYYLKAHLFGDIFSRNNLTFADRELITIVYQMIVIRQRSKLKNTVPIIFYFHLLFKTRFIEIFYQTKIFRKIFSKNFRGKFNVIIVFFKK